MPEVAQKQVNKWLITITVMLPTIMEIVDTSVANVALPHMQGSLNAGTDEVTWVLTSYLVSNAVVLPMTGWLSRMFGRKRFLITCIILFTLASFLCGAAPNLGTLIFFRILQGAAGGALIPTSQAILMETFPPREQGMANGHLRRRRHVRPHRRTGAGRLDHRQPELALDLLHQHPHRHHRRHHGDLFHLRPVLPETTENEHRLLGTGAFDGRSRRAADRARQGTAGGLVQFFFHPFMFRHLHCRSDVSSSMSNLSTSIPIVNLRLFKNISFSAGNFIMFMVGFCLYSSIMLIPLFLQTLMGYNATLAGMVLAPGGVATLITMPLVGAYIQRDDGRKVVFAGLLIGAVSMFMMQRFTLEASYWDFVWPRVVLGIGLAMIFVPLTTVTLASIAREEMGNATGIFNLLRNIGGSVGIAIAATLIARYSQFYQNSLVGHVNPYSPQTQEKLAALKKSAMMGGVDQVSADKVSLAALYGMVHRQAGILAYNHIFWIVGLVFLVVIPLLFLLKRPRHHDGLTLH